LIEFWHDIYNSTYESNQCAEVLSNLWSEFIRIAVKQNPSITVEDIIRSFSRFSRFSEEFKEILRHRALHYLNLEH
jgi:hypothetical protein